MLSIDPPIVELFNAVFVGTSFSVAFASANTSDRVISTYDGIGGREGVSQKSNHFWLSHQHI